jgi:putative peptide zinc metalloprotease protein
VEAARKNLAELNRHKKRLELVARREGIVMNLPATEEIGKSWEKDQTMPFCSIGDPNRLRVELPLATVDYDLVLDDLKRSGSQVPVTVRVQGRGDKTWKGKVAHTPESEAKTIRLALSSKGGGPLAVKPGSNDPKEMIPQSQVYLVGIDILDSDKAICPGALAQVKIHCRYRSGAWWVWRTVSATFDLGLL